jgi:peptide/nickel transport system permease protein
MTTAVTERGSRTGRAPAITRKARTSRKAPWGMLLAAGWIGSLALLAIFAPLLPLQDPNVADYDAIAALPSSDHWLGTDGIGRDHLSRAVYGARASLTVAIAAVGLGLSVGLFLGLVAGYFRGWVDAAVSALTDVVLAFPTLVFLMVLVSVRGPGISTLVVGLGVVMVPTFTRLARANTLAWSQREFVRAAEMAGARPFRVLLRDIAPNVMPAVLSYAVVVVSVAIVSEGSLSFLGFGLQSPTPSWGGMIAEGRSRLATDPFVIALPALFLFFTVASFNHLGDRLRGRGPQRMEIQL